MEGTTELRTQTASHIECAIYQEVNSDFLETDKNSITSLQAIEVQLNDVNRRIETVKELMIKSGNPSLETIKEEVAQKKNELNNKLHQSLEKANGHDDMSELKHLAAKCIDINNRDERSLFKQLVL
ncbi:hypothetical protein BCS84_18000 [Vibrio cyclitrophicus]|uniref:hypothetical protein n=1 Tax=Vibrio TaxID=662 RepID=UPI00037794B7|nr:MULTISPECIES: hypothetical protein [Vibrio]OEE18767.1 hypothetical protein OC1_21485 [Vibrio cyclitrophicus ZF207]OEF83755.1 hypothetical protein A148_07150 [Vibrio splendidus 1F-157]PMJ62041.1 hypothetical protein BCU23_20365 [Vibrio splendidus]PMK07622.1 hypothetical protein BCU10_03345 [Vibrio splendidus]PMP53189.1 hypothetical protein BCS84_20265 [Vibrio cyclitrophicus]